MVDVWLIIAAAVTSIAILVACFYTYVVYCHPEDKGFGQKIFFKVVVISGMFICSVMVLSLPLDVANSRGLGGGLNIDGTVKVIFMVMFLYIVFLLPFSMFLYETDEDKTLVVSAHQCGRIFEAVKLQMCTTLILGVLFFLAFGIFNDSKIPVRITQVALGRASASAAASLEPSPDFKNVESHLSYKLDFFNYVPVALGFLGWLLFVMFAGIGMVSLPMDLIMDFFFQPQYVACSHAAVCARAGRDQGDASDPHAGAAGLREDHQVEQGAPDSGRRGGLLQEVGQEPLAEEELQQAQERRHQPRRGSCGSASKSRCSTSNSRSQRTP